MTAPRPPARLALLLAAALGLHAGAPPRMAGPRVVEAASAAAKRTAKKKAPKKPARKTSKKRARKVVGLDLPPLPPGRTCYRAGAEVPEPPLLKSAPVELPAKVHGGPLRSALLVYEATIDKSGRIAEVKTLGKRPAEPPWPQLHDAAIAALKKYRYAKTIVRGAAAPVCLMVSLNLDLR